MKKILVLSVLSLLLCSPAADAQAKGGIPCTLWGCTEGAAALVKMSPQEKAFAARIASITSNMTEQDIEKLLGPVYRGGGTPRPVWLGPDGDKNSQVAVDYTRDAFCKCGG